MSRVIRLTQVSKWFGRTRALDDISLGVPPGTVCGLLGENGAGKTTAIRLMLGLDVADAGEVEVLGYDSRRQSTAIRRRVGYVPERPTLYEWMTAAEIGWFTAGFYPPGFEQRYLRLLTKLVVPLRTKITAMSKGMRAKVALALAQAHDPELLILDEPTSGIDVLVRHEFLDSMVDIAAQGRTVFFSSHQISEVERVAELIAIMRAGRLLVFEPLDELKRSVVEVTVTSVGAFNTPPNVGGRVLAAKQSGHQWQLVAREVPSERLAELERDTSIVAVDVRRLSLEEIYVAYIRQPNENVSSGTESIQESVKDSVKDSETR